VTAPGTPPLTPPHLLVLVGTDVHPFDRLVRWVRDWLADLTGAAPTCVVQYGTSAEPDGPLTAVAYLPHDELERMVAQAGVVVCHGGPATITEARRAGRLPIVVPRDPALGEHVDAHQQRFARMFGRSGLVRLAETEGELRAALDQSIHEPGAFTVTAADRAANGQAEPVRLVGDVVDGLIAARRRAPARAIGRARLRRAMRPR
jgi:UDP-N-acetylglucosamine transferase subunit ALG13